MMLIRAHESLLNQEQADTIFQKPDTVSDMLVCLKEESLKEAWRSNSCTIRKEPGPIDGNIFCRLIFYHISSDLFFYCDLKNIKHAFNKVKLYILLNLFRNILKILFIPFRQNNGFDSYTMGGKDLLFYSTHRKHLPP